MKKIGLLLMVMTLTGCSLFDKEPVIRTGADPCAEVRETALKMAETYDHLIEQQIKASRTETEIVLLTYMGELGITEVNWTRIEEIREEYQKTIK